MSGSFDAMSDDASTPSAAARDSGAAGRAAAVEVSVVVPVGRDVGDLKGLHGAISDELRRLNRSHEVIFIADGGGNRNPADLARDRQRALGSGGGKVPPVVRRERGPQRGIRTRPGRPW